MSKFAQETRPTPSTWLLQKARAILAEKFTEDEARAIEARILELFEYHDRQRSLTPEHSIWPRMLRRETQLLADLSRCNLARDFARDLVEPLKLHRQKLESMVAAISPRKKQRNVKFELACQIGATLKKMGIPLLIHERVDKEGRMRRTQFAAAVLAAFIALNEGSAKTKPYLIRARNLLTSLDDN